MKNSIIIIYLIFNLSTFTSAQFWEPLPSSPSGGPFRSIQIDSSGNIFAINNNMGVYRSTDSGNSWTNVFAQSELGFISINPKGCIYLKNTNKYDFKNIFFQLIMEIHGIILMIPF